MPVDTFKGIDTKTNTGTVTAVAQSSNPEAAIGLMAWKARTRTLSRLASATSPEKGQSCGYWPDSTPNAFDKKT